MGLALIGYTFTFVRLRGWYIPISILRMNHMLGWCSGVTFGQWGGGCIGAGLWRTSQGWTLLLPCILRIGLRSAASGRDSRGGCFPSCLLLRNIPRSLWMTAASAGISFRSGGFFLLLGGRGCFRCPARGLMSDFFLILPRDSSGSGSGIFVRMA